MKRNDFWLFEKNEVLLLLGLFACLSLIFIWRHVAKIPSHRNLVLVGDSNACTISNNGIGGYSPVSTHKKFQNQNRNIKFLQKLELNSADSVQLEALPMIGAKLAIRILKYRDRLGGFYTIDQLKEVYGLRDTCFQVIQNRIFVDSSKLRLIHINTCALEELGHHPYIGFKNAKVILKYRNEHQRINGEGELHAILGLHFESGEKWRKYLSYQ